MKLAPLREGRLETRGGRRTCGEMKPLRVKCIHKSVCVTSFNDVLTEARGNIYADSTLISYVIWSHQVFYGTLYQIVFHFFFNFL